MAKLEHPPAFQFYPADFVSDGLVEAMTSEEVGAYILLLCKAWYESPVGSIPDDDRVLARWARLSPDAWQVCKAHVLAPFTRRADGRLHQKRLRQSFDAQQTRKNERSEAGKRGAAKRWHHDSSIAKPWLSHSGANAEPMANDSSSSSSSSSGNYPTDNSNPPVVPHAGDERKRRKPAEYSPDFEAWWAVYPRHDAKGKAAEAWVKAVGVISAAYRMTRPDALAWLLRRSERFRDSEAGRAGQFVPHAATWLNQRRFDDDETEWDRPRGENARGVGPAGGTRLDREHERERQQLGILADFAAGKSGGLRDGDSSPRRIEANHGPDANSGGGVVRGSGGVSGDGGQFGGFATGTD